MKYSIIANSREYYEQIKKLIAQYDLSLSTKYYSQTLRELNRLEPTDLDGGSVAVDENGTVLAWLRANPVDDEIWGKSLVMRISDYVPPVDPKGAVFKSLFGKEIANKTHGILEYKIFCSAFDQNLLWTLVELGFGIQQAYGFAPLSILEEKLNLDTGSIRGIKIEELNRGNQAQFEKFYSLIAVTQAQPPTFAGAPDQYLSELKSGFHDLIADKSISTYICFNGDKAIGYQAWHPENKHIIELSVCGTIPEERGKGMGRALTVYGVKKALEAGFTECVTDWRTANPFSSSFWPSLGFRPYTYRLVRRLTHALIEDAEKHKDIFD